MKLGEGKRYDSGACRSCGAVLNAVAGVDTEDLPKPGNVSLCLYCGDITIYAEDGKLREPTPEEMYEITSDPHIMAVQAIRKKAGDKHRH